MNNESQKNHLGKHVIRRIIIGLIACLMSFNYTVLVTFADQLPSSELQALVGYPNWVGSSCGASSSGSSSGTLNVTPGTGSANGASFPKLDPSGMANAIDNFVKKQNSSSPLMGLGSIIVASAKQADVNPFIVPAIAIQETSLGTVSTPQVTQGNDIFNRRASPNQPSISIPTGLWYKWSSVKASVDYTAPENKNAAGGGDFLAYLRNQYGSSINSNDYSSLFQAYDPGYSAYATNVKSWINEMAANSGAPVATTGGTTSTCSCSGSAGGGLAASGAVSPQIGHGMTASAQQKFQQIVVAAGQKFKVNPNFAAAFYYTEMGRTGDSTNNADAASGSPVTGDGNWIEPAPPIGQGHQYVTNSLGYSEPYGLSQADAQTYHVDGNGDGSVSVTDLADAAFIAADLVAHNGATIGASDTTLYNAAFSYNHTSTYAQSVINTYHYALSKGSVTVTGTGSTGCGSQTPASCNNGSNTVTGSAAILCVAKQYQGIYYLNAGGHQGYAAFRQQCPISAVAGATKSSTPGNPGPCATDCSGLVSVAVDQAFNKSYTWIVDPSSGVMTGDSSAQYWKSIPISQAQPGDIVTLPDHVEIVDHVSGSTVYTFGSHHTGTQTGGISTSASYWTSGAWHWTGPTS